MKKLLGLVLSGMLVISIVGCENNEYTEDSNSLSIEESNELQEQEQEQAVDEPSVDDVDNYLKTGEWPDSADTSAKMAKFSRICQEARGKSVEMLGAEYEIRCKTKGMIDVDDFLKEKGFVDGKIYY